MKTSRVFDSPRETLFGMFTDAKKAATFWGPEGAVRHVFELDPRPGGALKIHDLDSEGTVHKTTGTVVSIVVPELFVFKSRTLPAEGGAPWEALQTLTFEALGPRRTRVTVEVKVLAVGSFPGGPDSLEEGFQGGWGETLEMLDRELHPVPPR